MAGVQRREPKLRRDLEIALRSFAADPSRRKLGTFKGDAAISNYNQLDSRLLGALCHGFQVLDAFFADVNDHCGDDELRSSVGGLDDEELWERARQTFERLEAIDH
jgi:hypothetical protein